MIPDTTLISNFSADGYAILENVYTETEIQQLTQLIDAADTANELIRKSSEVFAIRSVLHTIPGVKDIVLNRNFLQLLHATGGSDYFITKSIYFDKPAQSNWFVPYHQDLTISVDSKIDAEGFINPTVKHGQRGVQPPLPYLENTITLRIHLDDTDLRNGALYVIPGSHKNGVRRTETIQQEIHTETCCPVKRGGIMLMKPLLFHRSFRSEGTLRRRVLHIECCNLPLPPPAKWSEELLLLNSQKT